MKNQIDRLDPEIEAEYSEVIDQLQLPDLRLRRQRREVVLAAFEEAREAAKSPHENISWVWAAGVAAAVVTAALLCYAVLVSKYDAFKDLPATATNPANRPPKEDPALRDLNVTLAIVNARTAAAERELAWLSAMRAETENEAIDSWMKPQLQQP